MAFRINSNIGAMSTINYLTNGTNNLNKNLTSLSSALAINKAADDAASLSIANKFMSQVSEYGQRIMNANDSVGMIQIADGALSEQSNILDRVNVLTLKASNSTLSDSNRKGIQQEIDRLMQSSNNIANTTSYNGMGLLNGSGSTPYTKDTTTDALFTQAIDVTSVSAAESSLNDIKSASDVVSKERADLGSVQNQLASDIRNMTSGAINAAAAESQLRDVDFAAESANFSKNNILNQTGTFALAHQNTAQANVLSLLK